MATSVQPNCDETVQIPVDERNTAQERIKSIYEDPDDVEFGELLEGFRAGLKERRILLKNGIEEQDYESLRVICHQLKGAGGGYGYPELTEKAAAAESICKNSQWADLPQAINELCDYIGRMV